MPCMYIRDPRMCVCVRVCVRACGWVGGCVVVCVCVRVCVSIYLYMRTHICSSGTRDGTRAAGMESAIGQQFDRGTKFNVTVTVGEKVAPRVPFVKKV